MKKSANAATNLAAVGLITVQSATLMGSPPAAAADDAGMMAFNDHCRQCHSYVKGDNRIGPSLYGVVGRKAGTEANFAYSQALKNSQVTWTPEILDKWIANPNEVINGNNMGTLFSGLSDAGARQKIINFLKSDTHLKSNGSK